MEYSSTIERRPHSVREVCGVPLAFPRCPKGLRYLFRSGRSQFPSHYYFAFFFPDFCDFYL